MFPFLNNILGGIHYDLNGPNITVYKPVSTKITENQSLFWKISLPLLPTDIIG